MVRSARIVLVIVALFAVLLVWSYVGVVDEVSSGTGKVIPTSREQVIQSLEGGILAELHVAEGQIVEQGQILAQLDPTKVGSNVEESAARYRAALASTVRLEAEVAERPLKFPAELKAYPELIASETQLFEARKRSLEQSTSWIVQALKLVRSELSITESLLKDGAASDVEVIRLRRQAADLELKLSETRSEYRVRARDELTKAQAEVKALSSVVKGRADSLTRLTHRSPVRGVVKQIGVTTIGGVIPPNGMLMEIVPLDDKLLIEARISPQDIAFIRPGQEAKVKITAYDYAVYGGLDGVVTTISPDTIQDEVKPELYYYRVFIQTTTDALVNKAGKRFPIVPGMIATVDIRTGEKTVFEYLIKPLNRAREALRER
ncbi:MAG: HlyD family type I secretion periplasmic adaptor subunit [Pigmentiphaga sp.]|uniref:HlyD family type I secretion periplasmic adaptor subunit n=1 Tax=Pigmentiphaga sp. TaxID=1977564 RepID=UPI0029A1A274|nr:HlyD family type I secretion periplasmic adaptor subunit [Pigmentiphaga sp.]MDX3906514.1 HlyD family type I secretion periplasmic adaptor subunit [Pigmentiphaga sp.]